MLKQMFDYKTWADKRTLRTVESIDKHAFPDAYAFVHQQINHIVIVEELFRRRIEGYPEPHTSTNTDVLPSFDELKARLLASGEWYINYVSNSPDAERQITFVFADGLRGCMTVQEILFHILNHGSCHRGNIAHALDLASVAHPVDGYGIYIHEKEPSRRE